MPSPPQLCPAIFQFPDRLSGVFEEEKPQGEMNPHNLRQQRNTVIELPSLRVIHLGAACE